MRDQALGCLSRFAIAATFAALEEGLKPAEHSRPAAITLGQFGKGSEAVMTEPHERTFLVRMQLPTHRSFRLPGPAGDPRVNQQTRAVDFQILTRSLKVSAVRVDSYGAPFSAATQVALKLGRTIDALPAPPFQNLLGIHKRLKHALGRGGNVNFGDNGVSVGSSFGCSHEPASAYV